MPPRLTIEEVEIRHPDFKKGQIWVNCAQKYIFICKIHGEYKQWFGNASKCPNCKYIKMGITKSLGIKEAEKRCPDLKKGQIWGGTHIKYIFVCKIHGEYLQTFDHHYHMNKGCKQCGLIKSSISNRLPQEKVEKEYPEFKRNQIWTGVSEKYIFICEKHGEYRQTYACHHNGRRCPKCFEDNCGKHLLLKIEDVEKAYPDMKKGQTWVKAKSKYIFICKIHGEYLQSYRVHSRGSLCPRCRDPRGEKAIFEFLQKNKLNRVFTRQLQFKDCRDKGVLRFDFGSIEKKILIEFQGEQHYRPILYFGAKTKEESEERFLVYKKRDRIKKQWARKNGYKLITVSYKVRDIPLYLTKKLNLG